MTSSRRGVQVEITVSLGVAMLTATVVLAGFFLATHAAQTERLRPLLGRALSAEAGRLSLLHEMAGSSALWFIVRGDGQSRYVAQPPGGTTYDTRNTTAELDPVARWLAAEARREGKPLLRVGLPWEPIRFASPIAGPTRTEVAVAVLSPAVPRSAVFGLLLADVVAFALLGSYLLKRRVITPLRGLAEAARSIGEAGPGTRVVVDGVDEAVEVGRAFNEMSEALELRSTALEKAVAELRSVNQRLQRARDGLDRAERMAAVGHLAAGVAHEVGNPMGAVLAFLDLAQRDSSLSKSALDYLARASVQGERVREILRQLLDFSRPSRAECSPVDIAGCASQAIGLVGAQSRYRSVVFELVVDEGVEDALADESLVAQILLNLVLNAADAALSCEEHRVRLTVEPAPLRRRAHDRRDDPGRRRLSDAVECRVEDSGPGVPAEDRERIFDPFFTTKPPGEGTGLGLANVQRLSEELGGAIELGPPSELGGASFALKLPSAAGGDRPADVRLR